MLLSPPANATAIRLTNLEKRNQQLRDAFYKRCTNLHRLLKPSREVVVQQLADEYYLSAKTVECLLYTKSA